MGCYCHLGSLLERTNMNKTHRSIISFVRGVLVFHALMVLLAPATASIALAQTETQEPDPFAEFGGDQAASSGNGAAAAALTLEGFAEVEYAGHIGQKSPVDKNLIQENVRVRLKSALLNDNGGAYFKLDFIEDGITGESAVDVREARLHYTPWNWMDLNLGKQVSTWGVGDMVFINDLFPKNWVAMFSGRDMEMWKDSASAMRMGAYMGPFTWDVVYHPRFAPDTTPTGCRYAVYDPNQQDTVAFPQTCAETPSGTPLTKQQDDGEVAMRVKSQIGGMELALYSYRGFYKNPRGLMWLDANGVPVTGTPNPGAGDFMMPYYPRLVAYGWSLEGQAGPGILSVESGFYDSREDSDGDQFFIENSMWKYLLGYRMDFSANFGAGLQWYMEDMQDYEAYEEATLANNPAGYEYRKEKRHNTYTLRLTLKLQQDTLWVNYFAYQRPEDKDSYQKLDFTKRLDNNYVLAGGVNVFDGDENRADREFSMVRNDDNAFVRLQYNF